MRLTRQQAQELIEMAVKAAPLEICGLLAGNEQEVRAVIPITNIAAVPNHFFEFDQPSFIRAMFAIQREGMELIAIYHSHPAGEPIPSPIDVVQAYYPDTKYLIVGLGKSQPQIAAWSIRNHEVRNIELQLDSATPQSAQLELSNTGRTAIILSALIAVCLALMIALSLLPPAPVIP